jgi:iron complex outermembrane receptor protein
LRYLQSFATIIMAMSLASGFAQTTAVEDSVKLKRYTLNTIRVVADQPSQTIGALTIKTINKGELGSPLNLKETMQNLSGISNTVGTKDESNLRIRGFRKNEVKILIDGRPLNSGYFGNVDLNNIPVSDLKEIIIIKGPASSMYGSNTMGGVVNLITNEPSNDKWLKLGLSAKRNNTNQIELSSSHSFEDWDYWVYTARDHTDGIVLSRDFEPTIMENGGVRNNQLKTQYNFQSKLNRTIGEYNSIGFTGGITSIDRKEIPSSIYDNSYRLYRDWMRYQSTVLGEFHLGEQATLLSMLYYDGSRDTYQQFNDSHYQYMTVDSDMTNHTIGINPRIVYSPGLHNLTLGYRGEWQENRRKDNGNYPDWTLHQMDIQNAFTQWEYQPSDAIQVTGSMGLSMFHTDLKDSYSAYLEPAIGVYWDGTRGQSLSLALGQNTAFPTMRQFFSLENGNPNLKPQSAMKYEISGKQSFAVAGRSANLGATFYLNEVQDLIDRFEGRYVNIYRVRSYGGEASLLLKPISALEFDLSYAYLNYDQNSDYRLTESPIHSCELVQRYALPYNTSMTISSAYKDIRYSQDDAFVYRTLEAYWLHNIQLQKRWNSLTANLGIENILDTNYETEYGFPAPGINFNIGIELEL